MSFCLSRTNSDALRQFPTAWKDQILTDGMTWGIQKPVKRRHLYDISSASPTPTLWYRLALQACLVILLPRIAVIHTIFGTPSRPHSYPTSKVQKRQKRIQNREVAFNSQKNFRRVLITAKSYYYLRRVCLSVGTSVCLFVCPHITIRPPPDGISRNLVFEYFSNACRANSSLAEIRHE
jgi:hypothetical protein